MMLIPSICPFHPGGFRDESESVLFGEKDKGILRYTYTRGGPFFSYPRFLCLSWKSLLTRGREGSFRVPMQKETNATDRKRGKKNMMGEE